MLFSSTTTRADSQRIPTRSGPRPRYRRTASRSQRSLPPTRLGTGPYPRAAQRLEQVKRTATIEVTQARRAVDVTNQSRLVAEKARDLAKETDRLVRTAYQEGRGTSLELVAAATTLRQAEISLALREFEVVRARVAAVIALSTCSY